MSVVEATGGISFAKIDVSGSGDTTIVALVTGKKIRVVSLVVVSAASVVATFKSDSTSISGPLSLELGERMETSAPWGCFETAAGEALVLNLSGAVQCSGWLSYQQIV